LDQPFHITLNCFPRGRQHRLAGIENNAPLRIEAGQLYPYGFAHAAPHAISRHGLSHGPGNSEPGFRPILLFSARETKCREVLAGKAKAFIINFAEIAGTEDPARFWEAEPAAFNGDRITRRGERGARH